MQRVYQSVPACRWCAAFRPPPGRRGRGETDGVDYHFLSDEEFAATPPEG